jgi:hypothetical protein
MRSSAITNALLRLDHFTGSLPSPFERPNESIDFFVLELGRDKDIEAWCARTADALRLHSDLLKQVRGAGARATLFVESSSDVLRFEVSFLRVLSEIGIALECSHANA